MSPEHKDIVPVTTSAPLFDDLEYEGLPNESTPDNEGSTPGMQTRMSSTDVEQVLFNANWYNRNPISEEERHLPSRGAQAHMKGHKFTRDATERYPVCAGTTQVEVTEERQVHILVIRDEGATGLQFGSTEKYPDRDFLPTFPTTPAQAHEYFVRSGETSNDPEVGLRLESARRSRSSKRTSLNILPEHHPKTKHSA